MPRPFTSAAGQTILNIGGNDIGFFERVERSLNKISQSRAGQTLLDGILANRTARKKYVTIHPPGPNGISECACASVDSSVCRTQLAQGVFDLPAKFRNELRKCLLLAGHVDDGAWLAQEINAAPVYDIRGIPNPAPANLGVTGAHANAWLDGTAVFPAPFAGVQVSRLQRALLVALWPQARHHRGLGGHSSVRWRKESGSLHLTTGAVQVRSKSIGLAHELVHAYYNGAGLQMGLDNPLPDDNGVPTVESAALFEYMCVGLGIWSDEPISENAIRGQWHTVVKRTLFAGRVSIFYNASASRPCY